MRTVRVVSWNVAGRVRAQRQQAAVIAACDASVVALQEVTRRTLPLWRAALAEMGLVGVESSLDAMSGPVGRRVLGVVTAARAPLERLAAPDVPWPERVLCCASDGVEVV